MKIVRNGIKDGLIEELIGITVIDRKTKSCFNMDLHKSKHGSK